MVWVAAFPAAVHADETYTDDQSSGSTRVEDSAIVVPKGDKVNITIHLKVTKKGVEGSGMGAANLVGMDATASNLIFATPEVSKTVGAKFPQGINWNTADKQITLKKSKYDEADMIYMVTQVKNSEAVPHSMQDVHKLILANTQGALDTVKHIAAGTSFTIQAGGVSVTLKCVKHPPVKK
jgi:hypothetical protein